MLAARPAALAPPAPGAVIGERFRIERELGVGGMGAVYAAIDVHTGAPLALKLMRPELSGDERAVERFRREGAALAAVRHPAVVQVREVGELPDGTLYLAMELLEGETLSARLTRTGPMSPQELLPIVRGLADALAAAHAGGVIHRDIKPSNIHLPDPRALAAAALTGETAPVKLVDFGVARIRGYAQVTSSGLAVGTIRYMAPEQLGGGAVDERVDLYALGVVMYEALSGKHPFDLASGDDPIGAILVGRMTPLSSLRPDLPPSITSVVHRAMARVPMERFASAPALAEAFRQAVLEAPIVHPTPGSAPIAFAETVAVSTPQGGVVVPATTPAAVPIPQTSIPRTSPSVRPAPLAPLRTPPRKRSLAVWMIVPLLAGLCVLPGGAAAGVVGCTVWMADAQLRLGLDTLRATVEREGLDLYRADLDALDAMVEDGGVDMFATTVLVDRIQRALADDQQIDAREAAWVMVLGHDVVARGGQYTLEHYGKMNDANRAGPPN
ncbi:MAG: protein kinase [Sandaracinaceae bacterium]|nr:protein kinase [Sandaracinaceae bacterium]